MIKLSCVIPSFKDPYNKKTVEDLLKKSELGEGLEIIVVQDGFWFSNDLIVNDPRVRYVHLGKNVGMREAINAGVRVSRGEFLMRTDEHCMFDQGFDKKMTDVCKPNWIMTAIRYALDPVKWEIMKDVPPFIHEKLKIRDNMKFEGQRWPSRDKKYKHRKISHTMATQGSVWVQSRSWWDKVIGELSTEGYGSMYQDQHEMVFKTWKAGGELMLNQETWFAHKHYSFPRSHRYGSQDQDPSIKFCLNTWREYYEQVVKPRWKI